MVTERKAFKLVNFGDAMINRLLTKLEETTLPVVLGVLVGAVAIASVSSLSSDTERVKVFPREEGRPIVMRTYRHNARDQIYVQNSNGDYIPMTDYLATISDEADREIERIQIRKVAGFYEK